MKLVILIDEIALHTLLNKKIRVRITKKFKSKFTFSSRDMKAESYERLIIISRHDSRIIILWMVPI